MAPAAESPAPASRATAAQKARRAARARRQRAEARKRAEAREQARAADRSRQPAPDPTLARVGALIPGSSTDDGNSGELLFLAACALLALVCASGSFVSVASRISKGQLR